MLHCGEICETAKTETNSYAKNKQNSVRYLLPFKWTLDQQPLRWLYVHGVYAQPPSPQGRPQHPPKLRVEVPYGGSSRGLTAPMTAQTTSIVNLRHHNTAETYCGRGSYFGNPFDHNRLGITRDEACNKFEDYFYKKLRDPNFRGMVLSLRGKKLGCWCRCLPACDNPKCKTHRCHVETIVNYLEAYGRNH